MRIESFHIDGFGTLADLGVEGLSPGLVIVQGPNEAGKSTLLDFFTTMLFGFPQRRDNSSLSRARFGGAATAASSSSPRTTASRRVGHGGSSGTRPPQRAQHPATGREIGVRRRAAKGARRGR